MNKVNRQNRQTKSTLRQRQAAATARLIADAAKELFLRQGYASTTIEAVAERAGVAGSTVYLVFGSKRGILRAIRAAWHEQSHIRDVVFGDHGDVGTAERIGRLAHATRRQWETGADVVAIYQGAAASDPEAADELNLALDGRRKGMEHFAQELAADLRPGTSPQRAAAILQALCSPEVFHQLVRRSGWTPDAYEEWLAQILKRELIG